MVQTLIKDILLLTKIDDSLANDISDKLEELNIILIKLQTHIEILKELTKSSKLFNLLQHIHSQAFI